MSKPAGSEVELEMAVLIDVGSIQHWIPIKTDSWAALILFVGQKFKNNQSSIQKYILTNILLTESMHRHLIADRVSGLRDILLVVAGLIGN